MDVLTQEEFTEARDRIQQALAVSAEEYPHAIPAFRDLMEDHHHLRAWYAASRPLMDLLAHYSPSAQRLVADWTLRMEG